MRGRDIKRYGYEFADLWLINAHNGIKEKNIPPIDVADYPAIKAHLHRYYEQLSKRQDKGDTPFNLRNCAYMDDFSKQKIIYPETTQHASFYFDEDGAFYVDKTCFILISKYNYYLLATLSSSLFEYAYKRIFSSIELGLNGYQYNKHALIELPICPLNLVSKEILDQIINLTKEIKCRDKFEVTFKKIDSLIFSIYNISDAEQQHIYNHLSVFSN